MEQVDLDVTNPRFLGWPDNEYDWIHSRLWMGGWPEGGRVASPFRAVVRCARSPRYSERGVAIHAIEFDDAQDPRALPQNAALAAAARFALAQAERGDVLIHCAAGVNRSGLVMGIALVEAGLTPESALALMRARRAPAVLHNSVFRRRLLTWVPEREHAKARKPRRRKSRPESLRSVR